MAVYRTGGDQVTNFDKITANRIAKTENENHRLTPKPTGGFGKLLCCLHYFSVRSSGCCYGLKIFLSLTEDLHEEVFTPD